jgi:hypothetical protein
MAWTPGSWMGLDGGSDGVLEQLRQDVVERHLDVGKPCADVTWGQFYKTFFGIIYANINLFPIIFTPILAYIGRIKFYNINPWSNICN